MVVANRIDRLQPEKSIVVTLLYTWRRQAIDDYLEAPVYCLFVYLFNLYPLCNGYQAKISYILI